MDTHLISQALTVVHHATTHIATDLEAGADQGLTKIGADLTQLAAKKLLRAF